MPTGDAAYNLEQAIITWWRQDLGLPAMYETADMPQAGATETVSAADITAAEILARALRLMEEQSFGDPVVL